MTDHSHLDNLTLRVLKRFANGTLASLPEILISNPVIEGLVVAVQQYRNKFNKLNVLEQVKILHPSYFSVEDSNEISNEELLDLVLDNQYKYNLQKVQGLISDSLIFKSKDPNFKWAEIVDKSLELIKKGSLNDGFTSSYDSSVYSYKTLQPVMKFGYDLLDHYLCGGICPKDFIIMYGSVNSGKTTSATAHLAISALRQGKTPLVVSLEGDPIKMVRRIMSAGVGLFDQNPTTLLGNQLLQLNEYAKTLPELVVIDRKASKKRQMETYIGRYNPDVIIYDQITISGNGRDFTEMAKTSDMLKQIAQEYGIPVIALTQSAEKNYGGRLKEEKDRDHQVEVGAIKYSQALLEDATHVIHIGLHPISPNKRLLSIIKTKDDKTQKKITGGELLNIVIEMTPNGMQDTGILDRHKFISKTEIIEKPIENHIIQEVKMVEEAKKVPVEIVSEFDQLVEEANIKPIKDTPMLGTTIKTQLGNISKIEMETTLYSQEIYESTPDRLKLVAKQANNDADLNRLAEFFYENVHSYGEDEDSPNYFITEHHMPEYDANNVYKPYFLGKKNE